MDRRTLLAFALIFVLYVVWIRLYENWYGKPAGTAPADSTVTLVQDEQQGQAAEVDTTRPAIRVEPQAAEEDTPAAGGDLSENPLALVQAETLSPPIRVRTPLYDLVISPIGARISSWQGKDFRGMDDGPVQLIPAGSEEILEGGDAIVFTRQEWDLTSARFSVEGPAEIVLDEGGESQSVAFRAETAAGLQVRKIYTFHPGRYDIDLHLELGSTDPGAVPGLLLTTGDPLRARFGWPQGIASTEQNKKWEDPMFRSFAMVGEEVEFRKRRDLKKDVSRVVGDLSGSVRYAGQQNKYFHVAALAAGEPGTVIEGRIHLDGDPLRNQQTWWIEVPLRQQMTGTAAFAVAEVQLYLGPSEYDILRSYGKDLEKTMDLGWKLFRPLSELVLSFMNWLHRFIPNYGLIIIFLSVLTKLMFYPLTRTSTRSMKRMQEVQPKIKALQEKYKDQKEKLSSEMMKLYREEKINPMAGCLPLLVQSPVFIALYQVLSKTIALRQAPFGLWIHDLAQPDALFTLPLSLPIFGENFNLLPILMSLSMYFQTKLTPTTAAGGQMAIMNTMMPIMMLVFFYNMPSGLVLYWLTNTVMQIYQTWKIQKSAPVTGGAQTA